MFIEANSSHDDVNQVYFVTTNGIHHNTTELCRSSRSHNNTIRLTHSKRSHVFHVCVE